MFDYVRCVVLLICWTALFCNWYTLILFFFYPENRSIMLLLNLWKSSVPTTWYVLGLNLSSLFSAPLRPIASFKIQWNVQCVERTGIFLGHIKIFFCFPFQREGSDVHAKITCLVYSYNGTGWLTFSFLLFCC